MLVMVLILIVTILLLISIDRVSGVHTTDGRRRRVSDHRILQQVFAPSATEAIIVKDVCRRIKRCESGGDKVYRLFQKTALLIVTVVCGVPFSAAEGACAHRIPTDENKVEDTKAFCVVNQDLGKAVDAAIEACGGHAEKGHDLDHKCFVDPLWVQEGGGKWRTSGGSDSFPNSKCGAVAVAPAQTKAEILFFASYANTVAEASANAIGACDQENPSFTPHLKCSVIAAKACDTLPPST